MLEPRVLLDAAAAHTAQEAIAQQAAAPPPEPAHAPQDHAGLMDALAAVHGDVPAAAQPARTEVYFIDASMTGAAHLAQALPSGSEVHFIEPEADGVAFIAQTLQGRSDIDAIHILSHGETGALQLGTAALTARTMQDTYRGELAAIGQSLAADGDILVYGCDFGAGDAGTQAVQTLAGLTGADVAASTDDTGAAALGGDWALERQVGTVQAAAASAQEWDHLMVAPVLSTAPVLGYAGVEDAGAPAGAVGVLVSDYTVGMSDADAGAVKGIAITRNVATNGAWWFTTDGGATWTEVGTVATNNALLLADNASTRLHFQSRANFSGNAGNALTLRGWDQSVGAAGTKANPTTLAGALSSASDTVAVSVAAVNDAPVLTTTAFNVSFTGETRFTYTVTAGGVTETATVTVTVTVRAAVGEGDVPVARDDYPFVARPPEPERDRFDDRRPFADADGLFAEPAVVIAVNGQDWLGGTPAIVGASGVVLQAVNGVDSLGGLNTLSGRGVVVAAVDDLAPLGSIDTRDAGHKGDWLRGLAGAQLDAEPGRSASLDLGNDVRLAMTQQGQRVWIDVQSNVREVRASLAGGGALPAWVHVDRRGFVAIDRPADAERLRLRLTVVPQRGATRSHTVDIDFNSGEVREVDGSRREVGRMRDGRASSGFAQVLASVPDFGTQLERAATRPSEDDAQLLEALGQV